MKPYKTPFTKRPIVDKLIDDMLAVNVIQPSRSPWNFPIVIVDKKDGSKRFCTNFRKLDLISKRSSWPLPVTDGMLAVLGKAEFFTILDLKSEVLANAPGIFHKVMSIVLQDLVNSSSIKEHIRHIQRFFGRLRQHQTKLKLSKCKFLQKETQYLGFIISESDIKADHDKVHVIRNMVPPKCVRDKNLHACAVIIEDLVQSFQP